MATKKVTPLRPASEELAEEAAPTRKPKGSPNLYPFLSLPRRRRADFIRSLKAVISRQQAMSEVEEDADEMDRAADGFDLVADMEDLLRLVAADADAFDTWASKAADETLGTLLTWYMERFQPGEATASQS